MAARTTGEQLLGRQRERDVLDRVLEEARDGRGGVLALYGDAGVGKTALLEYAAEAAPDFRVVRAAGVEGEIELAFAAVQQLCSPSLDLLERLPDPQREAFEVAQWLDRASARVLAFVARRLLAERVAMFFAAREPVGALAGLAELHVEPLGHRDARALLDSALPGRLDERVLERIVLETRGNPLALLELPRGLSPAQLAGGFGLAAALPLSAGIEQSFTRRLERLPRDARRLLLLAAAEPLGDPALLWRAAKHLGIPETAADAVEGEGLLTLEGAVTFRHPLVRSAAYGAAEPDERRRAHLALAESTDPEIDPDRRAWHQAQAASVPDESVAAELERSAARAQARGGLAAAAAFLERATALTPEEARRSQRALAAAQAKVQAGALDDASSLVATAESGRLGEVEQARAALLRGQISFLSTRASEATLLLLEAAERLREIDPGLARETYLEAVTAAI